MGRSAQAAGVRSRWTTRGPQWGLGLAILATSVSLGALAQADIAVVGAHESKLHPSYPDYISKQDCLDNTNVTFSISVTGVTTLSSVQVWVSDYKEAKCWNTEYRDNQDTAKYCAAVQMSLKDPLLVIDAQTIIGHLRDAKADECTDTSTFADHERQLYFYFVTDEDKTDGAAGDKVYAVWDKGWVDLEGPEPTDFKLGTGEESLIVKYTISAAGSDVAKYSFYCAALPAGEGGMCTPLPDLTPGKVPAALGDCATDVSGASGENTLKNLMNGTTYTVAMAALDKVDNLGPLSEFKCETPQATESFFDAYREAGGQAGGGCGLCSAGGDTRTSLPALVGGAMAFAVFAARRRRRRDIPRGLREAE